MLYPERYGANPRFPQTDDFCVIDCGTRFGWGVVCRRTFRPGELVAEIAGEILPDITQHTLQIAPGKHFLDPYFTGYLLHSCEPNVSLDMQALTVTALRLIRPNDYLTMDYAQTEDVLYRQFPCSCGTATCRGWITGRAEPVDDIAFHHHQRCQGQRITKRAG